MKEKNNYIELVSVTKDEKNHFHSSPVGKSLRIKATKNSAETIVVSGLTVSHGLKHFQFSVIAPQQQMQQRNSAYQFFSLD